MNIILGWNVECTGHNAVGFKSKNGWKLNLVKNAFSILTFQSLVAVQPRVYNISVLNESFFSQFKQWPIYLFA